MKLLMKDYFSNTRREFDIDMPCLEDFDTANHVDKCRGLYADVGDKTVGLAERDGRLYVVLDERVFEVDKSLTVHHSAGARIRRLVIEKGAEQLSVDYVNDSDPASTQYYSEDEEDADFGLWLHGVLSSPERKRIVLSSWANNDL